MTVTDRRTRLDSLMKEKNLWSLAKTTLRFGVSLTNRVIILLFCTILAVVLSSQVYEGKKLGDIISIVSNLGFNFASAILGFLIAGFTIFATMTDKNLFLKMLDVDNLTYSISYLKYIMLTFMDVFIQYLLIILLCFIFILIGGKDGVNWDDDSINQWFSYSALYTISSLIVLAMMSLTSFVFNVYNSINLTISWHVEQSSAAGSSGGGTP